jgi:hypothetical protein
VGIGAVLVVVLSAATIGVVGRRFLAPRWSGAAGALVVVVLAYSFLVIEGELLGSFGWFSRWPIVLTSLVVAAGALAVSGRARPERSAADPAGNSNEPAARDRGGFWHRVPPYAAAGCAALVFAQAIVAVIATSRTGNLFIDSLEYHLTWASHFATTHHTGDIIQIAPSSPTSYYPLNSELLHGMGIALFHRDSLSLLLTTVDLGVVMLAAWCVGSAFGVGPVALCAVTPILALLGTFDASAINDWTAVWPLVALLAIAVRFRVDGEQATVGLPFVAGLAGGLAMGSKLSLLAPTLALLLGFLFLVTRGRRLTATVLVVAGAGLTSLYWYVRNAVQVGSPFPTQDLPGLHRVPMPELDKYDFSVAHYLTNTSVIRHFFRPGLEFFLGRGWIALLLLAVIGVVVGALYGPDGLRMASVIAVLATIAYLITPTGAFGPPDQPYLFGYNVRYALPALAIGLVLFGSCRLATRWPCAVALVSAALLVVTLTGPRMWALGHVATFAAIAVTVVLALVVRLQAVRRHGGVLVAGVVVIAVAVGYQANAHYLDDRYQGRGTPKEALYQSMQAQSGATIGVVGLPVLYPYLGSGFQNTTVYVGEKLSDEEFRDYQTCEAWRAAVHDGGFDFIVVQMSAGNPPPPAYDWTSADPAASKLFENEAGSVFAIGPGFGTGACAAAT